MEPSNDPGVVGRRLCHEHGPAVQRYFRRLTGDRALAEDLSQETLLRVLRGAAEATRLDNERAWVFRIATNLFLNHRRRDARAPFVAGRAELVQPAPQLARLSLREALDALAADDRAALLLREIGGLGYGEIAAATGSTVAAVRSRIYRSRLALRERLLPPAPTPVVAIRRLEDDD